MAYPTIRKLDGTFFRVERDGEWCNICWTDLTDDERAKVSEGRSRIWWSNLCHEMIEVLIDISNSLNRSVTDDPCSSNDTKWLCMTLTSAVRAIGDAYDVVAYDGAETW